MVRAPDHLLVDGVISPYFQEIVVFFFLYLQLIYSNLMKEYLKNGILNALFCRLNNP